MSVHATESSGLSSKQTVLIAGASLGLGIIFDYLFYGKIPGVSFMLYVLLVLGAIFGMARLVGKTVPNAAYVLVVPLLFFASMLFVRAGPLLVFLDTVVSLYLLALIAWLLYKPDLHKYMPYEYLKPMLDLPLQIVLKFFAFVGGIASLHTLARRHALVAQIVRGALIAIPLLVVFGALFASADLVFQKFVHDIFNLHINSDAVSRVIIALIVASFFAGLFSYIHKPLPAVAKHAARAGQFPRLGNVEMMIIFGSLNVLFFLFIIVQLAYLFGGQSNITGQGFTYAEYAHKGFSELVTATVAAFVVVLSAEKLVRRENATHTLRFNVQVVALVAQVMVIIVSAFKRLSLYEQAYGYTSLRIYVQVATVWLAVISCILLYKIIRRQGDTVLALGVFATALLAVGFINVCNVDGFVARENIARYYATGNLDVQYLNSLSDDAAGDTAVLLHAPDARLQSAVASALYDREQRLLRSDSDWQSWNATRSRVLEILAPDQPILDENKGEPADLQIKVLQ